jgi:hypothetical protein
VQENHVGLKLNGTHQLLAYADDGYLLADNMETVDKNTDLLLDGICGCLLTRTQVKMVI